MLTSSESRHPPCRTPCVPSPRDAPHCSPSWRAPRWTVCSPRSPRTGADYVPRRRTGSAAGRPPPLAGRSSRTTPARGRRLLALTPAMTQAGSSTRSDQAAADGSGGRGREGWSTAYNGSGTPAQVRAASTRHRRSVPSSSPAAHPGTNDDEPIASLPDGIRSCATDQQGTGRQEVRFTMISAAPLDLDVRSEPA